MAGQPRKAQLLRDIKAQGGFPKIWERVMSGETQTAIAKSFRVSQGQLSIVINAEPERQREWLAARRASGQVRADRALEIVENVPADRDEINRARLQSDVLRWHAGSYERETFGDSPPQVNVGVNLAQMSIEAMRAPLGLQEAELAKLPTNLVCQNHKRVLPCPQCDPVLVEQTRQRLVEAGRIWDRPQLPAPHAVEVDVPGPDEGSPEP